MAPKEQIYSYPNPAGERVRCIFENPEDEEQDNDGQINFDLINIGSEEEDEGFDFFNPESEMEQLEEVTSEEWDALEQIFLNLDLAQVDQQNLSGNVVFEGIFNVPNHFEWDSEESE